MFNRIRPANADIPLPLTENTGNRCTDRFFAFFINITTASVELAIAAGTPATRRTENTLKSRKKCLKCGFFIKIYD